MENQRLKGMSNISKKLNSLYDHPGKIDLYVNPPETKYAKGV